MMMTMLRRTALSLALAGATGAATAAFADEPTGEAAQQRLVNAEIDAIKTGGQTPSNACLAALQDMHTAEQQLIDLTGSSSNAPSGSALAENEQGEVAIARDVFGSDLDAAASSCRADAAQACAGPAAVKAAKSCGIMARSPP